MVSIREIINVAADLSCKEKISFDSYVHCDNLDKEVNHILAGIDMASPELLLASHLGADCVIGHHPAGGCAIKNMHKDLDYQIEKFDKIGMLTPAIVDKLKKLKEHRKEEHYGFNYYRVTSFSEQLDIPFMNLHTTIDIITENYIADLIANNIERDDSIDELMCLLSKIREIERSIENPRIVFGNKADKVGKVLPIFTHTPDIDLFNLYFRNGVNTIICMYPPKNIDVSCLDEVDKRIIGIGHMGGDSIGMNILLNKLSNEYNVKVTRVSGLL
jgi:hypothetical protein